VRKRPLFAHCGCPAYGGFAPDSGPSIPTLVGSEAVHKSRMLHANLAIDIAGLFSCVIQVQKYSVVFDR